MEKKNWRLMALASVLVAASGGVVISSSAQAQSRWNAEALRAEPAANRTPTPPPIQIPGSWNGTIQDSKAGNGTINLTFTETGKVRGVLRGTWTTNLPNDQPEGAINDLGRLTGTVTGNMVSMTLIPRKGDALGNCKIVFTSPDATEEMFSGNYHTLVCGNTGTISVQPGPADTSTVFINVSDDFFYPPRVTISAGQTVRWTNNGHEQHSVNANSASNKCKPASTESFDSPDINTGETFDHTFNVPGSYAYHCQPHGCPMRGIITVQ